MNSIFPELVNRLPEAGLNIPGLEIHISQANDHEIWFLETTQEIAYPAHSHCAQWSTVLKGEIRVDIAGKSKTYGRGDCYYLPQGIEHSVTMSPDYAEILYLDHPNLLDR